MTQGECVLGGVHEIPPQQDVFFTSQYLRVHRTITVQQVGKTDPTIAIPRLKKNGLTCAYHKTHRLKKPVAMCLFTMKANQLLHIRQSSPS